jgi:hypothetical protein
MDEGIEVAPSEENGNVPLETPSEQPIEETPALEETVDTTEPEPQIDLYDLPDGRKVDGATLAREWKENFLPDYTRKSQALAEKERANINNNETTENPYADPNYIPQSYEEILKVAEERALRAFENRQQEAIAQQQAVEQEVAMHLSAIKKADPTVNEEALFTHANKYGFNDLTLAYQNMRDMGKIVKTVQKTTADNISKRNDPVSITPNGTGTLPNPNNFSSAKDYLRSLK